MITIDDIQQILIVGAGTMGQQIGLQCALHGYEVMLYDVQEEALATAVSRIAAYLAHFVKDKRITLDEAVAIKERIFTTTDAETAAMDADLLSESVPEDPVLKGKVLGQFNQLCPPRTIFTTNTSTLLPSMFATATGRPSQFAAFHFHLPVWDANVVDVMPHAGTDTAVTTLLATFAQRIGQIPIVLDKEHSGYVFNAMLSALLKSAISLVVDGVATPADVDRAWMGIMKTPIGPFGIQDSIGLDTVWKITDFWAKIGGHSTDLANAAFLKTYLDQGKTGIKSGQGFYSYPNPAFAQPDFLHKSE